MLLVNDDNVYNYMNIFKKLTGIAEKQETVEEKWQTQLKFPRKKN